jgi:hypothetical protein
VPTPPASPFIAKLSPLIEVCIDEQERIMFVEIWAKLTNQKVVYLKDHDGEVTKTVARCTPFGYVARRHFQDVLLLPEGKVQGPIYVTAWAEF